MPRGARPTPGGSCNHVLNSGNGPAEVFHNDGDFAAFLKAPREVAGEVPLRPLAYCLMPNHFHLVCWPKGDRDLSRGLQRLLTAHVRSYHAHYHSSGHVWQGWFKAFPIQEDRHLLTVLRYVERNALRAGLVRRAEDWTWSSLSGRAPGRRADFLADAPVALGRGWVESVNAPQTEAEEAALRQCVSRGPPFGGGSWVGRSAARLRHMEAHMPGGFKYNAGGPGTTG